MILVWALLVVVGLGGAIIASGRAVEHASALAFGLKVPPFFIGITLLAIGTDLPEIANSIIASIADHGDLNVGDSVGSTITQVTLVLGLLPILARRSFIVGRRRVLVPSLVIAFSLGTIAILLRDGFFSRLDGLTLVGLWIIGSAVVWRNAPPASEPVLAVPTRRRSYHALATLLGLGVVGGGATLAVVGFIEIAEILDVPEFIVAFFATSIGTSLPELVVDLTAIRRGERDLAIGDIFGSSIVDASLSIGIGPLIAPTAITASLAVVSSLGGVVTMLAIAGLMSRFERHNAWTGLALIGLYAAFYPVLLLLG